MKLAEVLSFVAEHSGCWAKPCRNFSKDFETPLRSFRNRLFYRPDALPPSTEVTGKNAFWMKYSDLLGILGKDPLAKDREHASELLRLTEGTSQWKFQPEVGCFVSHARHTPKEEFRQSSQAFGQWEGGIHSFQKHGKELVDEPTSCHYLQS